MTESSDDGQAPDRNWFLLKGEGVPVGWRDRAEIVYMVSLLPGESEALLATGAATPQVDAGDIPLVRLLALGLTTEDISRRLGMSHRSVQRRTGRLKEHFGVDSKGELSLFLARSGF